MELFKVKEAVFDFVYRMALNDATNQQAYTGKRSDIESKENVKACVKEYIEEVMSGRKADFMETAKSIYQEASGDSFSFGNIQKLINMTAKYMYITCYGDEDLRANFKDCHCPMDGIMIQKVRKCYRETYKENNWDDNLLKIPYGGGETGIDGSIIRWSKISFEKTDDPTSFEVYENYQKMVKLLAEHDGIYPIEYDYVNWNR